MKVLLAYVFYVSVDFQHKNRRVCLINKLCRLIIAHGSVLVILLWLF